MFVFYQVNSQPVELKVAEAVWQLERNMDAQVITVINRDPVTAAAPLPELKLLYYVRQHTSESLKEVEGEPQLQNICSKWVLGIVQNLVVQYCRVLVAVRMLEDWGTTATSGLHMSCHAST